MKYVISIFIFISIVGVNPCYSEGVEKKAYEYEMVEMRKGWDLSDPEYQELNAQIEILVVQRKVNNISYFPEDDSLFAIFYWETRGSEKKNFFPNKQQKETFDIEITDYRGMKPAREAFFKRDYATGVAKMSEYLSKFPNSKKGLRYQEFLLTLKRLKEGNTNQVLTSLTNAVVVSKVPSSENDEYFLMDANSQAVKAIIFEKEPSKAPGEKLEGYILENPYLDASIFFEKRKR